MTNPFLKIQDHTRLINYLQSIGFKHQNFQIDKVNDIKDLNSSKINEITFFHSKKYAELARSTKASYCITTEKFKSFLPNSCKAIISDNVLLHTAQITKIFYPDSVTDDFDVSVKDIKNTVFKDKVKFGKMY